VKVYISGGITGVPNHRERFLAACDIVEGWSGVNEIVTPFDIPPCADGSCQHWPGNPRSNGHTWMCWLKYDIAEMVKCDMIATLPGWELSRGAVLEVTIALNLGIKVVAITADALDEALIEMEMEDEEEAPRLSIVNVVDGL